MASIFPATGIDNFTTKVDTSDYPTASHINDLQNAIITVQTKVGIDGSADTNSLDYKITDLWKTIYPVGAVYFSYVSTDPGTLFGGTWSAITGGKFIVTYDSTDTDFNAAGDTGGAKTHTLTTNEMPAHTHYGNSKSGAGVSIFEAATDYTAAPISQRLTSSTGGGATHNNLPPFFTLYAWRRTV